MKRILMSLVALCLIGSSVPAFAGEGGPAHSDCAICSKTTSDNWGVKAGSTMTRGVANVVGSPMELVRQPMKEMGSEGETHNPVIGVCKGVGHMCMRAMKGAGEIITSPMPKAKDGSQIAEDCPMCMWKKS